MGAAAIRVYHARMPSSGDMSEHPARRETAAQGQSR
jgi:hypothetical protein